MASFNAAAARAKRPFPVWVDAFQRDTQHLEADEIGAYFLILMAMWTRESCDFPDDDTRLARVSRVSTRLWKSRIGPVIRAFLTAEQGVVFSKRLREEATYVERHVQQQSDRKAGEKNGKPLKDNDTTPSADTSADEPRGYPTQQPNNPTLSKGDAKASPCAIGESQPSEPKPPSFDDFWASWPLSKVGKDAARKAFGRLSPRQRIGATAHAAEWCRSWRAANPRLNDIHPSTYLNNKRWEDEAPSNGGQNAQATFFGNRPSSGGPRSGRGQQPDGILGAVLRSRAARAN